MIGFIQVLLTFVAIGLLIFMIMKNAYAPMSLLALGFIILFFWSLLTGQSIMGEESVGNWFLDIFEFMKSYFCSQYIGLGMILLPLMGFTRYMNHIHATEMLTSLCSKPLQKIKNPYVIVGCTVILGALLEIAIPSHTGLSVLLIITLFPVLRSCGISKLTAAAAILLGGAMDLGPAAPMPIYGLSEIHSGMTAAEYFIRIQIPVSTLPILLSAVLCAVVNWKWDQKAGYLAERQETAEIPSSEIGVPRFYALFPLIPLVFIIIFSKLVVSSIVISVCAAVFISLFICTTIEIIRSHSVIHSMDATKTFFEGMGDGYTVTIVLIAAASVFAGALQKIGGLTVLAELISKTPLNGMVVFAIIGLLGMFIIIFTGSPNAGMAPFTDSILNLINTYHIMPEIALLPIQLSMGYGRVLSPIGSAVLTVASMVDVDIIALVKRNIIPVGGAYLLNIIIAAILQ